VEDDRIKLIIEIQDLVGRLTKLTNYGLELPTRYPKPSSINLTGQQLEVWQLIRDADESYNCASIGKKLMNSHSDWDKKRANGVASRTLSRLFKRYGLIEYIGKTAVVEKGRLLSHYRTIRDNSNN
jgi:sulfur relay (sulfurtransferase) DsrC/TusE family protein